jgi:hypothetical protein
MSERIRERERAEKSAECGELEASLIHQKKRKRKRKLEASFAP